MFFYDFMPDKTPVSFPVFFSMFPSQCLLPHHYHLSTGTIFFSARKVSTHHCLLNMCFEMSPKILSKYSAYNLYNFTTRLWISHVYYITPNNYTNGFKLNTHQVKTSLFFLPFIMLNISFYLKNR